MKAFFIKFFYFISCLHICLLKRLSRANWFTVQWTRILRACGQLFTHLAGHSWRAAFRNWTWCSFAFRAAFYKIISKKFLSNFLKKLILFTHFWFLWKPRARRWLGTIVDQFRMVWRLKNLGPNFHDTFRYWPACVKSHKLLQFFHSLNFIPKNFSFASFFFVQNFSVDSNGK